MAPWWARQLAVFGSLSPSTASGKVLFIRDIGEWNSITTPATLDHLLGMGLGPLLASRIGGLVAAVMIYTTLVAGFVLAPFMVIGGWARRRSLDFGPFFAYAALLFAFSAIVSAVHVPGGTFIHSAVALAPYSYILALEGIALAVAWVARRRPRWDAAAATRFFVGAAVVFAVAAARRSAPSSVHATWTARADRFRTIAGGARCRRCAGHGPGHVHRRVGDEVLDGPRGRGPRQRSARDDRARSRAPTTSAGSCSTRTTASARSPRSSTAGPAGLARGRPILDPGRPAAPRGLPGRSRGRAVSRREALLSAGLVFVVAARRPGALRGRRSSSPSPRTRPTTSASRATSSRAAGSSRTRCGATRRRRSSSRDRRSRSGSRCRRSSRRSRWRSPGRRFARRPGLVGPHRLAGPGARLAARRRRRAGARPAAPGARGRSRSAPA